MNAFIFRPREMKKEFGSVVCGNAEVKAKCATAAKMGVQWVLTH